MKVEFYFDVCCPWCWITSRWLAEVDKNRDIDIIWRSFSLALKNNQLDNNKGGYEGKIHRASHPVMRVVEAVRAKYGEEKVGEFYARLGRQWHLKNNQSDQAILPVLRELNLDPSLLDAKDDKKWDKVLQKSLDSAVKVAGEDIGTPTIVFTNQRTRSGFFGPIFTKLPDKNEGLRIWDSLSTLAGYPHFYELKRTRNEHPDVRTTERTV